MYTVYQAQPFISILYLMVAKYKCAFVGSDQLDRPSCQRRRIEFGMLFSECSKFEINLEL